MYEYWLHVLKEGHTIVINPAKIVSVSIDYNGNDNVIVSFDGNDNYYSFTKDEWKTRELKREFRNYGNIPSFCTEKADEVDTSTSVKPNSGEKTVRFSTMTRGEFVKWLGNCKSINDSCAESALIPYGAYEYVNRVFEQINILATVKADKDGNVILTAKEWGFVKDALTAQQNGCNPCGETIAEVADLLARMD